MQAQSHARTDTDIDRQTHACIRTHTHTHTTHTQHTHTQVMLPGFARLFVCFVILLPLFLSAVGLFLLVSSNELIAYFSILLL